MQNSKLSGKMPIIDTFKTAGVIGLLMQQTVAVCDVDTMKPSQAEERCSFICGSEKKPAIKTIDGALAYIRELTSQLRDTYRSLASASREDAVAMVQALRMAGVELVEQQLKAMDGTGKAVYKDASDDRKAEIKPIVLTVALARSAASDLNHLIKQMTVPVTVFKSDIDRNALLELAEHGTSVIYSSRFH